MTEVGLGPLPVRRDLSDRILALFSASRPHQWLKNVLLCAPAIAAHRLDWPTGRNVLVAFVSLSLVASGSYILNDLLDLEADRQHPRKKLRALAAGRISTAGGVSVIVATWLVGVGLAAALLPRRLVAALGIYLLATTLYSLRMKRQPVLDVMVLTGLYVIRIVAGGFATSIPVSTWLLTFALFMCLSLAFLKRYVEVIAQPGDAISGIPGRGYQVADAQWLQAAGIASGYLSAVVLAIYVNNPDVMRLYAHPERLLLMCPVLLYWMTRMWLNAHRRVMPDDPVVAVAADPITYVLLVIATVIVLSAV